MMESPQQWLKERLPEVDWDDGKLEQFRQFYQLLINWNKRINLTAITSEEEVYLKHFYDSLTLVRVVHFAEVGNVVDVGTGGGFPGIPVKIAFPHLQITLLDSQKKRLRFLDEVIEQLGLKQVQTLHARAEDIGRKKEYREQYDLVTARAVARLPVIAEYGLPLARLGGAFVAMKGKQGLEELEEARGAIYKLGGGEPQVDAFSLPLDAGDRVLIRIPKEGKTPPAYPRRAGLPAQNPLK